MNHPAARQPDADERQFSEEDARALVRLLGEVCAQPDGHRFRKAFLLDGLCELIEADGWISNLSGQSIPSDPSFPTGRKLCFVNTHLDRLVDSLEMGDPVLHSAPDAAQAIALSQPHAAGPLIVSSWSRGEQGVSQFVIHRSCGRPLFTAREAGLIEIVLSEISWLHDAEWAIESADDALGLPPRESIVLHLLLKGESRKGIADRLGISINTVAGYARTIYQKTGVRSQAELLRSFVNGGKPKDDLPVTSPPNDAQSLWDG